MADEVTPIVETVPTEAPAPVAEPIVVVEVTQSPVVENPNSVEVIIEPTLNPVEAATEPTAQLGGNEPLVTESKPIETVVSNPEVPDPKGLGVEPALNPVVTGSGEQVVSAVPRSGIRELLVKAQSVIQFRKRKKLDQVMGIFLKRTSVTNDEVEKLLHVSDATATRYLSILEKEGKITQTGKTGKGVAYIKI